MNIDPLNGATGALVRLALDAAQARHRALAANIANAGVPGYTPLRLGFGEQLAQLRDAMAAGDTRVLDGVQALQPDAPAGGADRVELDQEVAGLAENTLQYQALMRGLSRHMSLISLALNEGRK
ncbi:MAG: flagellar basal body protein [Aquabacterium sp.]|jgi:flagellar basal-body rod protein FlgB|nr:MAG: flagellar basal body protein [Aquabacterium sp.]TAL13632.1 MAG: flagellar basal body protein [Aquabacterium sp.]